MEIAILVISDSRTLDTDTSGAYLAEQIATSTHSVFTRAIVKDNVDEIQNIVQKWIKQPSIDAIICTGGTGFSGRDSTPDAIEPLLEKPVPGFGELFRWLSYTDIGSSTVQSRAFAGITNKTLIVALPGSLRACQLAWDKILDEQLNPMHEPCNFAEVIDRLKVTSNS